MPTTIQAEYVVHHPKPSILRVLAILCVFLLPVVPLRAQEGSDIVRGRVLGPGGESLPDVLVTVTGVQTGAVRTARTNASGHYTVLFAASEGEYLVEVRRVGFSPRVVRVARQGDETILVADVDLALVARQLDEVHVTTQRPRPQRQVDARSVGGLEPDVLRGALFSLDPGDLNALAASVPGVLAVPGANGDSSAFSVLGASPDQNNIVVDGNQFGGGALPPDALAAARLVTTSFDPARGQFAGGMLTARTRGGTDVPQANLRANVAPAQLAWSDPAAPRPPAYLRTASGSIGGPIRKQKAHYFGAFELRRSITEARSLIDAPAEALAPYGLSRDTVDALTSTLGTLGIPLTADGVPVGSADDRHTALVKVDLTPTATTSLGVRADAAWNGRRGGVGSPLALPTLGTRSASSQLGLQVSGSGYLRGFLDEFRSYVQTSTSTSSPNLALPTGSVRVGVQREDGATGLTSLRFGGGASGGSERRATRWETTNELSLISADSRHRVKLGQLVAFERTWTTQAQDRFGSFTFESLEDLAANRPASYARTLTTRARSTDAVSAAAWLGDEWRAAHNVRVQYGVRADLARPTVHPDNNPAIEERFGLRTDDVPTDLGYSPRLGVSWSPWMPRPVERRGMPFSRPDTSRGGAPQAPVPRRPAAPSRWHLVSISGGIGAFRGVIPPARTASLMDATGLPSTTRRLTCVGVATPLPDWTAAAGNAPDSCVDGTEAGEFASSNPFVQVMSPGFSAPVSWRSNLALDGVTFAGLRLRGDATLSIGVAGESSVDVNLRDTAAFSLRDEGNRPVYAPSTSIVATTGQIAPGAARLDDRFGRVTALVSDARSVATQLQVSAGSVRPLFGKIPLNGSYTWSRQRAQERGFTGTTAGDPFAKEWARGRQPVHQISVSTFTRVRALQLSLRLTVQSGTRYTPIVAGDVNGDGNNNDRAFVPAPDAADPALAAEMRALLGTAPRRARACLTQQLGTIAGAGSCTTGWHVRPDINVNLLPLDNLGFGDRLRFSLTMLNGSAAVARALGMQDLTGMAQLLPPDATLLYKTGFDPEARRYTYRVNQQFGDAMNRGAARGQFSPPFQVQLGLEYRFGGPSRERMARSLGLVAEPGRAPLTPEEVRARLRRLHQNPITTVLERRAILKLDSAQVVRLDSLGVQYTAQADSAAAPLLSYLTSARRVTDVEVTRRLGALGPAMQRLMRGATERVAGILTDAQRAQLPPWYFANGPQPSTARPTRGVRGAR